jgi:hypothetical protein
MARPPIRFKSQEPSRVSSRWLQHEIVMASPNNGIRHDPTALLFPGANNSWVRTHDRPSTEAMGTYKASADFADFQAYQP